MWVSMTAGIGLADTETFLMTVVLWYDSRQAMRTQHCHTEHSVMLEKYINRASSLIRDASCTLCCLSGMAHQLSGVMFRFTPNFSLLFLVAATATGTPRATLIQPACRLCWNVTDRALTTFDASHHFSVPLAQCPSLDLTRRHACKASEASQREREREN